MAAVRVVGVGNDFRCDDAAGLLVVRRLKELGCSAELHESDGEGGAIIELMRDCDRIVIVDATTAKREPGTITEFDVSSSPLPIVSVAETGHAFAVAQGIETARALGRLPNEVWFFGIEGVQFHHGIGLGDDVNRAVEDVAYRVMARLGEAVLQS